jgi:hypothetical protein
MRHDSGVLVLVVVLIVLALVSALVSARVSARVSALVSARVSFAALQKVQEVSCDGPTQSRVADGEWVQTTAL